MNLAKNMRRLRRDADLTQEELARHIGCTPQAISKWERGEGFPEITLLPAIAGYFKVSLDELFGMAEIQKAERIKEIYIKHLENAELGKRNENIKLMRDAICEFPHEYQLYITLAVDLSMVDDDSSETKREAVKIYEWLIAQGYTAAERNLMHAYSDIGELEKAREIAVKGHDTFSTADYQYPRFCTGAERVKAAQVGLSTFFSAAFDMISFMIDDEFDVDLSVAERIAILNKSAQLFELIYEGAGGFFDITQIDTYRCIAELSLEIGDFESAIINLEYCADYAITFDKGGYWTGEKQLDRERPTHRPVLFSRIGTGALAIPIYPTPNKCAKLLEDIKDAKYNLIRNDRRFCAVAERLEQYAEVVAGRLP